MCALPYAHHQPLPKIPGYNTSIGKDDVTSWFKGASGATRVDTMCALLECCNPFEIRFIGSVLEVLGKKDSAHLREVCHKANHFLKRPGGNLEENRNSLFLNLSYKEEPLPKPNAPPLNSLSSINLNQVSSPVGPNCESHLNPTTNEPQKSQHTPSTNNDAPGSGSVGCGRTKGVYEPPQLRQQILSRNHSPAASALPLTQHPLLNGSGSVSGRSNCSSEEDTWDEEVEGSKDLLVLHFDTPRQKTLIYLTLLSSTNHEAANVYYSLISQVERTLGNRKWLEKQSEQTMEEILLLYTIGIHHPAFTFEQRLMLLEILIKLRGESTRRKSVAFPYYPPLQHIYDSPYGPYYLPHVLPSGDQGPCSVSGSGHIPSPRLGGHYFPPYPLYNPLNPPPNAPNAQVLGSSCLRDVESTGSTPLEPSPSDRSVPGLVVQGEKQAPPLVEKIPPLPLSGESQSQIVRSDKIFCFNCGYEGHLGHGCTQKNIEQMTAHFYQLQYEDNNNKHN